MGKPKCILVSEMATVVANAGGMIGALERGNMRIPVMHQNHHLEASLNVH
jgi:hypothetical protein